MMDEVCHICLPHLLLDAASGICSLLMDAVVPHLPLGTAPVWWHSLFMDAVLQHLPLDAAPVWCNFLLIAAQFATSAARCGVSLVAIPVDGCSLPHVSLDATFAFCILLMDVVCRICCWMQRLPVVSFLIIDCCSFPHLPLDAASVWCVPLMDVVCRICHWLRQSGGIPVDVCSLPHLLLDVCVPLTRTVASSACLLLDAALVW